MKDTKKQKRKVATITTVNDVLTEDNVRDAFARMVEELPNITDMVCIYRDRNGETNWKTTAEITIERVVSMLEIVKHCILSESDEPENEER